VSNQQYIFRASKYITVGSKIGEKANFPDLFEWLNLGPPPTNEIPQLVKEIKRSSHGLETRKFL
jgi:hypothetical protein